MVRKYIFCIHFRLGRWRTDSNNLFLCCRILGHLLGRVKADMILFSSQLFYWEWNYSPFYIFLKTHSCISLSVWNVNKINILGILRYWNQALNLNLRLLFWFAFLVFCCWFWFGIGWVFLFGLMIGLGVFLLFSQLPLWVSLHIRKPEKWDFYFSPGILTWQS